MPQPNEPNMHPMLTERKPRNHNAALMVIVAIVAAILLGALLFRVVNGKSAAVPVDPLSPVPAETQ